ncbi:hypothetical protein FACS189456_4110 [Bacteroidia bacterium]|nr:hypothetical protein FACS189456_4110 [Bacteroidia bacterium]
MNMKHLIYGMSIFALAVGMAGCEDETNVSGITFVVESLTLDIGKKGQVVVQPVPAGTSFDTRQIKWGTTDPVFATVTDFGIVTANEETQADNPVFITATYGGKTLELPITVIDPAGELPARKGSWLFDNASNPYEAAVGNAIVPCKDRWPSFENPTTDLNGFTVVPGPLPGDGALQVSRGYSLFANHGLVAKGVPGATRVNEYTILFWLKHLGHPDNGGWKPYLKIRRPLQDPAVGDKGNNGDDFGLRSGARSWGWDQWVRDPIEGKMDGFDPKKWNRVVLTFKNGDGGFMRIYWNGSLIAQKDFNDPDYERTTLSVDGLGLFTRGSDGNPSINDEDDVQVTELAIWDVALNDNQVGKLDRLINKGIH